jgi:hypothetical protein|tara:strand:- start:46 stop:864 length:819 start_codon:yes stop_codon:yes gene_type:complete
MKALICGWFSFEGGGSTAGDWMAMQVLCRWLEEFGIDYDIAEEPTIRTEGVEWRKINPDQYEYLIYVCGPIIKNSQSQAELFRRFQGNAKLVGINVSMLSNGEGLEWNPFDVVVARDGIGTGFPDMAFASQPKILPIIGLILRGHQREYLAENCLHEQAEAYFSRLIDNFPCLVISIDTKTPNNRYGLRTLEEIETLISKMDVVLTTRLHGAVIALKNGVPSIAIDQIRSGAKVYAGLTTIGWPLVFKVDELKDGDKLKTALKYALSPEVQV